MSGKKSRSKGARGERKACRLMEKITGEEWKRTPGGDVQFAGDVVPVGVVAPPWSSCFVEVKSHQDVGIPQLIFPTAKVMGWHEKAEDEAARAGGRWPLLVVWVAGRGGVLALLQQDERHDFWRGVEPFVTWTGKTTWGKDRVRLIGVSE